MIAALEESVSDPLKLLKIRPYIRFNRNAVLGTLIENWIAARKIRVKEAMELDSPEAIASMVHANLGVSIVPDLAVRPKDSVPVRRLSLGADAPVRTLGLVHREDEVKMKALDEVFDALIRVIADAEAARREADT